MWVHFEVVSHVAAEACDFVSNPETVQFVISLTISPCLPPLQDEIPLLLLFCKPRAGLTPNVFWLLQMMKEDWIPVRLIARWDSLIGWSVRIQWKMNRVWFTRNGFLFHLLNWSQYADDLKPSNFPSFLPKEHIKTTLSFLSWPVCQGQAFQQIGLSYMGFVWKNCKVGMLILNFTMVSIPT